MTKKRIIYYADEHNDDFAENHIHKSTVGKTFPYMRTSLLWNGIAFIVYYLIAIPIAFVISKVYLGLRFKNKPSLKEIGKQGFYLYGNHTRHLDAFVPALAAFPRKAYVIANADAVSIPFLKNIVMMVGAIPIPTEAGGVRGFLKTVSVRYRRGSCVAVYPEAHIWPFYTGIRDFPDTSFKYPVKESAPVVAMVTTYRKRKGLFRLAKRPGMTVEFSEPFFPEKGLSVKEAQKDLRDKAYDFMKRVSENSENIEYIRYVKI